MEKIKKITNLKYTLNSGYCIPAIALGTYKIVKQEEIDVAIKAAYEKGYRHFDSAILYKNEDLIGSALKKYKIPRDEVFITTKIPPWAMTYKDAKQAIKQSLASFQTDYIDLFLIHWPEVDKLEKRLDVWKALEEGVKEGKIRSIGVSNFLIIHLKTILDNCTIKPAVNQIELHPLFIDWETIRFCEKEGILIESYSTFGQYDPMLINHKTVEKISKEKKKSPTQVLIRWAVQHNWVVLPKSSKCERIKENFEVDDFELSDNDIAELDSLNCDYKVTWDPRKVEF